ncbi:MAG: metallophosphoesterase family protein [Gammaproteobacteria bacterium]
MNQDDRILFAGDPHGDFEPLITSVRERKPEAVVLLGDYDLDKPLEYYLKGIIQSTQIWWIPGNHDFDHQYRYNCLFNSALADYGLHLKVRTIAGLKIAGLGGIFLGRVWYPPAKPRWRNKTHYLNRESSQSGKAGLSLKFKSAIWHDEVETLKRLRADILVTHEAPGCHIYGFQAIDEVARTMGVGKIFHGHQHDSYCSMLERDIFVVGVADRAVSNLAGKICFPTQICHP